MEPGLARLKEAGFRLVTLTNSPTKTLMQQMANTGLGAYFESLWSVDDVQLFKPHPQTYQLALSRLQLPPEQTMMVACHAWDLAGAAHAGMQTGFIARPGQSPYALAPAPTITGKTLTDLVEQLV
ncbi:HAD-IA family hydrolase [Spirosoma rhododendri]|uniref:HAD-IA family hydrolase n=1 Tax=Spirosoma rhododendri TaxID=2728024 RepID=UPI0020C52040|nr:HAD-IA family hydrolase [Spirosoma rhododendri]